MDCCHRNFGCDGDPEPRIVDGSEDILPSGDLGRWANTAATPCCVLAGWVSARRSNWAALAPQDGLDLAVEFPERCCKQAITPTTASGVPNGDSSKRDENSPGNW